MTCSEYIASMGEDYKPLKRLSDKNGASVLLFRNTRLLRDIVLRQYPSAVEAYDILKSFRCANLPEVFESLRFSDGQIVIEEYVSGITVAEILETGKYTFKGAKKVLTGVCSAVCALHSLGIIHRDIKPENVIITKEGAVKLIDLNASRLPSPDKARDTVALGTVGYAPPEQYGISQSNFTADIYAMGILLNVMLTGEHPGVKLARGKAGSIVLRCTSVSPDKRFQSAEKLMSAL